MTIEEQNKTRIMETAERMFIMNGYSNVTMNDIARELGMSKKTLYKYYTNKHSLLEITVHKRLQWMHELLDSIYLNPQMEFHEKLRGILSIVTSETTNLGNQVLTDIRKNAPTVWNFIETWRNQHIKSRFSMLLEEGIYRGFFRNDLNKEIVINYYMFALEQLFNNYNVNGKFAMHELLDHFIKLFYEGLMTDGARTQYRTKPTL